VELKKTSNFQCLVTFFVAKYVSQATGVLEQRISAQIEQLYKLGFILSYQDTQEKTLVGRMVLLAPPSKFNFLNYNLIF